MPPYKSPKKLQLLALEVVCQMTLDLIPQIKRHNIQLREYYINNVHAWARTSILANIKARLDDGANNFEIWDEFNGVFDTNPFLKIMIFKFNKWFIVLNAMLDIGISRLPPLFFHGGMEREFHIFVSMLKDYNTHLKELSLTFQMSSKNDYTPKVYSSMFLLQRSLNDGLASKLVSLKLVAICDNLILETIGEYALCLKHLDISGSWNVDEVGIRSLLIKKTVHMCSNNSVSNDKLCQDLSQLYDNKLMLNQCCFTLEELRIQDTNTEDASLLMILACVKSLKALGGFLYFRNIGDALVTVRKNSHTPRVFQLTELYDMQLTGTKISILKECLPHLKMLYTRLSCVCLPKDHVDLEQSLIFWNRVHALTIDLDYMVNSHFLKFISNYGYNLSELTILDQEDDIDVAQLLLSCPNLSVLKGYFHVFETPIGQFTKLRSMELHMPTVETIDWFFENCPSLEDAKLYSHSSHLYWNKRIFENPSFIVRNKLIRLELSFNDEEQIADIETIFRFIDQCLKLQYLGHLEKWNLDSNYILDVKHYVKQRNYNLTVY